MIAICPTQEKLKSLSLGQLPEEQSDELIRHLESCETCQEEISQIDDVDDTLIQQLKSAETDVADDFESENGCRVAVTRALAALASVGESTRISQDMADRDLTNVPKAIGEYDIVSPLGHGGMGHVYLGKHTKLNRPVAIKFLADHRRWDQSMHERFESEMRLIGGLNHPNIVVAHDAREVDGLAVLVTEYIDGMTVSEILKRTGTFSVAESAKVAAEVCKALQYIDSQGLVHRDIKPSNIMIDVDGTVKLLDLGLARLQASEEEITEFTATGQAMGTADYVAPEQVNDGRNVDIRADVYGLGCTLYKMLSGHAPFAKTHHTSFAKMNAHVSEVPATLDSVRGVSAELAKLVSQMLEKDPANRPQSPQEVLDRISRTAKTADLAALVATAKELPAQKIVSPVALNETPKTDVSFFGKYPWVAAIAGGLAAMAFGIWLGIIISVKKPDGTISKVEIPDGSTAIVDSEGNIEILLAGSELRLRIPGANVQVRPQNEDRKSDVMDMSKLLVPNSESSAGIKGFAPDDQASMLENNSNAAIINQMRFQILNLESEIFVEKARIAMQTERDESVVASEQLNDLPPIKVNRIAPTELDIESKIEKDQDVIRARQLVHTFQSSLRQQEMSRNPHLDDIRRIKGKLKQAENSLAKTELAIRNRVEKALNKTADEDYARRYEEALAQAKFDIEAVKQKQASSRAGKLADDLVNLKSSEAKLAFLKQQLEQEIRRLEKFSGINYKGVDPQYLLASRPTRLVAPKDSAIYGKIESGDRIDIIELKDNANGDPPERNLLVSNQKVKVTQFEGNTELIVNKLIVEQVTQSQSNGNRIEIEFHDSLRQQTVDEVNINGVWRVVLVKRNGRVDKSDDKKVVIFHRHQMIILDSNNEYAMHPFQIRIENTQPQLLVFGNASGDFQKAYYTFLESGRLDIEYSIASNDMGAGGGMQKMAASGSWRLERATEPQTDFEKTAFEIVAAANRAKNKVEFFIAKEDTSNQETRPDWIKAPYTDPNSGKHFRLIGKPVLSNEDILSARSLQQDGRHDIQITLTAAGEAKVKFHTGRNIGMYMAILVDHKLISAPKINSTIGRNCLISGNFTANEAKTIAAAIVPDMKITSNLNGTQSTLESRMRSLNNLRQLALGLHNFANANKSFPASANSKNGQPPHSWRVAILPYIGHQELFAKYNFDEPWDSEANRALLTEMPSLFRHPLMPATSDFTNYIGAVGKEYAFGTETGKDFAQFLDGTSNSILLIEADTKIPWTKPDDLDFEKQWKSFKSFEAKAIPVAFADGSTRVLGNSKLNATLWKFMFQISDGKVIDQTLFEVAEPIMDVFR